MTPPTTLAPVTIPVTLELDPVIIPPTVLAAVCVPVTLVLDPVITPPTTDAAVTVPVTDTLVPVCVVALTLAPPRTLPPVTLPVALNCDRESKLVAASYPNAVAEVLTDGV